MPEERPRIGAFKWIRQHWNELPEDIWLAIGEIGIVAQATSPGELRLALDMQALDTDAIAIVLRHDGKSLSAGNDLTIANA
jgi:hypothetical protein